MTIRIRPATLDDSSSILSLRNGQEAVFWSGKPPLEETSHAEWFPKNLSLILVLERGRIVQGYARIDRTGRVSFAVHESLVGRGYGRTLLLALEPLARAHTDLSHLWAEVHPSNVASMRVFMHAGYSLHPTRPLDCRYEWVLKAL